MKYLLLIYLNEANFAALSEEQRQAVFDGHGELIKSITESGELIRTDALASPPNSVTVRVRGGQVVATDGPYVETKEHLAGFYLVDCESRDRAIELAARIPDASFSAIEIRPLMDDGGTEM